MLRPSNNHRGQAHKSHRFLVVDVATNPKASQHANISNLQKADDA